LWTYDWHNNGHIIFTIVGVEMDALRAATYEVNGQSVRMIPFFSSSPDKIRTVMLYPPLLVTGQPYTLKIIYENGTVSEFSNLICGQRGELGGGDLGAMSRLPGHI
jgi:hypothetical protein